MTVLPGRPLVAGVGRGETLVLDGPLSLWGGLDPVTGRIIDRRHPQLGRSVEGRVLALPVGRGSSSASSILLESVRVGTSPAAIVLAELDAILALGAAVARELYDAGPPVVVLGREHYDVLETGMSASVESDGSVRVERPTAGRGVRDIPSPRSDLGRNR